jgi:hypothetical protein
MSEFGEFLFSGKVGRVSMKAYVDMSGMKTQAQLAAEQAENKPKKDAAAAIENLPFKTHTELGKALSEFGVSSTKDAYGQGPEAHGSAWRAKGNKTTQIQGWLEEQGFKKKGAYAWKLANFRVDVGKDARNTYLYITDDEGA